MAGRVKGFGRRQMNCQPERSRFAAGFFDPVARMSRNVEPVAGLQRQDRTVLKPERSSGVACPSE